MILLEEMIRYIKDHRQEVYGLFLELARIPAPSNHEEKQAEFCVDWLKVQDARGVHIDQAPDVVYPADARQGRPAEVFMAHTDAVFPNEVELPLRVEGGRIYRPNVGNNTACLVYLLLTGKYTTGYVDSPWQREVRGGSAPGLLLVCNAGEGGLGNLKRVRKICEGYDDGVERFCTFDGSLSSITDRVVGSKCSRIRVCTRGGHPYNNLENDNAIACLASSVGEPYGIRVSEDGRTTYNVGMISGGASVSIIAQEAEALYKPRFDRRENLEYIERQFMEVIDRGKSEGMDVSLEVVGVGPYEELVDPEQKQALPDWAHRVMEEMTGQVPRHCAGSTGCNIPLSLGIPSVYVGSPRDAGAYIREEYMETDSLEEGYKMAFGVISDSRNRF